MAHAYCVAAKATKGYGKYQQHQRVILQYILLNTCWSGLNTNNTWREILVLGFMPTAGILSQPAAGLLVAGSFSRHASASSTAARGLP